MSDLYVDHPLAALYVLTLVLGTYIFLPLALLSNALLPNVGGVVASTVTLVRFEQYRNAQLPMLVTLSGIVTFVRPEQPAKVLLLILVTLSGISTEAPLPTPPMLVRPVQ
jgi:hypothetical protein